jgi:TPR repeat protein
MPEISNYFRFVLVICFIFLSFTGSVASLGHLSSDSQLDVKLKEISEWLETQSGRPTDQELDKVKTWLLVKAKLLARTQSHTNLHREHKEISELFRRALPSAHRKGDGQAQAKLADYYFGKVVDRSPKIPINIEEATYWSTLCAAQENSTCLINLASLLEDNGTQKSHRLIFCLYMLASAKAEPESLNGLGHCYKHGIGIARDLESARYYFEMSAYQGNLNGQYNLGECYFSGCGVSVDYQRALEYFRLAFANQHMGAQEKITEINKLNENLDLPPYEECGTLHKFIYGDVQRKNICIKISRVFQEWFSSCSKASKNY